MKKLVIRHKDYVLKVHTLETDTIIFDSYKVKSPFDMESIIYYIKASTSDKDVVNNRSISSMIHEWRAYNLLHSLGIAKNRTRDVNFNLKQSWYIKTLYFILSLFYPYFK